METEKEVLKETHSQGAERKSIKENIRLKKERQKLGQFEKGAVECSECGSRQLVTDSVRAELVCSECGLVIERDIIDMGPEWRAFDEEQKNKKARTGPPLTVTMHDKGLTTVIDWRNRDSHGRALSASSITNYNKMRMLQRRIRVRNATERNLSFALSELDRMVSALGLSKFVHEEAAVIYRKAKKMNLIRGRSIEGMVSASLYAACRKHKNSRTLEEIAGTSRVSRKEIGISYRIISKKLKLGISTQSPIEYIPRFCSILNLSMDVQVMVAGILLAAEGNCKFSGRKPNVKVAAAIWKIAGGDNGGRNIVTQKQIAKVAGVTEVSIRNVTKELDSISGY